MDSLFQAAQDALSENRYSKAIDLFEQVAKARPDDIETHYWLGVSYWDRDQGDEAIAAYRKAVSLDPKGESDWSLYALENLAEVLTRTDHVKESQAAYEQALQRETRPEWIEKIKNQLAELKLTQGIYEPDSNTIFNARHEIIGGIGLGGMHTNHYFEIARHTNDPVKEAKYYRLAIDTDPSMYQSYFNLGLALLHQGKYREAVPWLLKSDSVWRQDSYDNPDGTAKTDANAFLTLCFLELGQLDSAAKYSSIAANSSGFYFWERLYTARLATAQGKPQSALLDLQPLLADNPEQPEVLHAMAEAYLALKDTAKAETYLKQAIGFIPDDHPWMGHLKAQWREKLGRL
ncbi:MAG: tetratricopeptide repeat protein [Candidatus Zixiibacteriota bacterium]|nr:MAG: tetratricopeptide repeat protein [candidate division Zixibacteria bacterium]